jgi:hypothetical protein
MLPTGFQCALQENRVFDTCGPAQCARRRPGALFGTVKSAPAQVLASTNQASKTMSPSIPRARLLRQLRKW